VTATGVDAERFLAHDRAGVGREAVARDCRAALEDRVTSIPAVLVPASGRVLVGLAEPGQDRAALEEAARC
jgi:hypothetical protein